jgi:hypothetical protein
MFFNCFEHAPALFGAFTCFNHQHALRSSQESFRNWRVIPTFDTQNFINCFCCSNLGIPTNSLHVIIFFKKIPDPSYPLPPENGEPMTGFLSWPGCWDSWLGYAPIPEVCSHHLRYPHTLHPKNKYCKEWMGLYHLISPILWLVAKSCTTKRMVENLK